MTSQITSPSSDVKFGYNSINERLVKSDLSAGSSVHYLRGLNDYPLYEKQNSDGDGSFDKIYIYGPTGLIAVKRMEGTYFALKDHLGSTRVIFDGATGDPVSYYDFTPYGNTMRVSGGIGLKYQFTGQEFNEEFALHNFRARMYDSDLAMFYGVDPAGQTSSPFGYGGNNPIKYVDPSGKFFFTLLGIISTAYSIFQGFISGGEQGAFISALSSGIGFASGGLINFGTLPLEIIGSSTLSGALTGGLTSIVAGGNLFQGMRSGALGGLAAGTITVGSIYMKGLMGGYDFKEPVPETRENLYKFKNSYNELKRMHAEAGKPEMYIVNKENLSSNFELKGKELYLKGTNELKGGYTKPLITEFKVLDNGLVSYPSEVYISPHSFSSGWKLYMTLGHEFVHASNYFSGLAAAWGFAGYNKPPEMEHFAYQWNFETALRWGNKAIIERYGNLFEKYNIYR